MEDYWKMDMSFSLNLLKQFLEDMEAYSNVSCCFAMPLGSYYALQELTGLSGMNESVSLSDEASTPEQCLSKLVALLRCVCVCVYVRVHVSVHAYVYVCLSLSLCGTVYDSDPSSNTDQVKYLSGPIKFNQTILLCTINGK